jgi:MFS family permease
MRRIYYGWWIVAATMLVYMLIVGSCFSAFGLFVKPVSAELDLSRADMNSALILLNLGMAVLAPFVGRLSDRLPVRVMLIASALLIGASLATLSFSETLMLSAGVTAIPLAIGVVGGTMSMSLLIARWFVVYRGRALTLSVIGNSLAGIVVAPAAGWLIDAEGWRIALLTIAITVTALLLSVSLLIRERPGPNDVESSANGARAATGALNPTQPQTPVPALLVLRMPQFWTISLAVATGLAIPQALMITIVPMALERGLSTIQSASLVSVAGLASIGGKLLLSIVADRVNRIVLLSALFALGSLTSAMLLVSDTYQLLLCAALLMGVTSGTIPPIYQALVADRFGLVSFGTVRGLVVPITAGIGAVAIRFIGEVFDRTGGYDIGFTVFIAAGLVAAALMYATSFTQPVRHS